MNELNDSQSALVDFERAIALDPQSAEAYCNRAILKYYQLNDSQGALADYDRAIALAPQFAEAYYNRGNLKNNKFNDSPEERLRQRAGAIQDFRYAAMLFRAQGQTQNLQGVIGLLEQLGATE